MRVDFINQERSDFGTAGLGSVVLFLFFSMPNNVNLTKKSQKSRDITITHQLGYN